MSLFIISIVLAFVFGAIIGSFLNVVIYRVPAELSIVSPGSRCPSCQTPIAWYDNIPILSWLALGAQCRACKAPIAWRYPAVEAATGFFSALLWLKIAGGPMQNLATLELAPILIDYGLHFVFVCLLIVIAMVDLDHLIIPHEFTIPGIILGIAAPFIIGRLYDPLTLITRWPAVFPSTAIFGAILGAGLVIAIFLLYLAARGVPGMGGGDVTLMALVGAWLGWPGVFFVLFAASIQGLIAAGIAYATGSSFLRNSNEIFAEDEAAEQAAQDASTPAKEDANDAPSSQGEEASGEQGEQSAQEAAASSGEAASAPALRKKPEVIVLEDEREEEAGPGLPAIPFGPFIVLSALEHYFLGALLPESISMAALYTL